MGRKKLLSRVTYCVVLSVVPQSLPHSLTHVHLSLLFALLCSAPLCFGLRSRRLLHQKKPANQLLSICFRASAKASASASKRCTTQHSTAQSGIPSSIDCAAASLLTAATKKRLGTTRRRVRKREKERERERGKKKWREFTFSRFPFSNVLFIIIIPMLNVADSAEANPAVVPASETAASSRFSISKAIRGKTSSSDRTLLIDENQSPSSNAAAENSYGSVPAAAAAADQPQRHPGTRFNWSLRKAIFGY